MAKMYDVGDLTRLTGTFKNSAGTSADPTAITFKCKTPDAVTTTYVYGTDAQLVKSSTGIYYVDWSITQAGLHIYEWIGTGAVQSAEDGYFRVNSRLI